MIEAMRRSPRSALVLAFLLGLGVSYLINFFLTLCYIALLGGSCALTIGIRRFGIGRQQIYEVLHLPTAARDLINNALPLTAEEQAHTFQQQREAPESFKFVGADLFDMSSDSGGSSPAKQSRRSEQIVSPSRHQGNFARMLPSTPGPALSTTRFRSNLNFILDSEVNSPGFTNRVVNYHRQENVSQDSPISPRTQIGEFRSIKLHQESPPTRKMNLSSQVGLPLIISTPVSPPNIYSQCLPPEDKSNQTEPSPSVLEALKEISRKRISNEDSRAPPVAKRYKNDFINSVAEFPAIIKETTSPAPKTVSKRGREHIEVTPEQSQTKSKQARVAKCNEIEASLSSSRMYQEQRATAKKRRATTTPQQEPQSKTVRTDEPLEKTPEQVTVVVQEEKSSPRPLFNLPSAEIKQAADTPKRKIISEEIYSPIKLQEKGKASKLLSQRELREKKLREFYEQLKDYKEPEVVEVEKTQEDTKAPTPVTSAIASMSSATTVTTSIQGPVVSSVSPMFKTAPITQQAASSGPEPTPAAVKPIIKTTTAPVATTAPSVPSFSLSAKPESAPTTAPPSFNFSSNTSTTTTAAAAVPTLNFASTSKTAESTSAQPTFSFGSSETKTSSSAAPVETAAAPKFNFSSISATAVSTTSAAPAMFTATTTSAAPALFTATTTAAPAFGTSTTPNFSFGGAPSTSFGAQTTAAASFGTTTTTSSSTSAFGVTTSTTASSLPSFGSSSQTFGTFGPSTSALPFPSTSTTSFGAPSTTASVSFGASTTAAPAAFGAQSTSAFGTPGAAAPAFGAPSTTAPPAFGTSSTAAPPTFGSAGTAAPPAFGAAATTAPPTFGSSIFGGAAATTTTASSAFGSSFGTSSTAFSTGVASPFGGGASDPKATGFGAFKPAAATTAAPTPGFSFNAITTTTNTASTNSIFGSSFPSTQSNASIFGSSAPAASAFGKPPEPATLPTNFKFGGDKTDTSPSAAASIFGVPPTQNPFGGTGPANSAPAAFPFGQAAQPAAPTFNATQTTGAFAFGATTSQQQQQPQQPAAFGFAPSQPAQFQASQPQQGVFTLGTSGTRRPALQARRRR